MKLFTGENKGTSIPAGASRLWNPLRAPPTSTLDSTSTRIYGWLVRQDIFVADRYNLDRCKKCWLHQDHLPCERGSPKFILRTRIVLSDTSCKDVRVHRQQANNIGRDLTFKSVCENSSKKVGFSAKAASFKPCLIPGAPSTSKPGQQYWIRINFQIL